MGNNLNILVTGAAGLIGSEAVEYFCNKGYNVVGIENNQREVFFGEKGSILLRLSDLIEKHRNYRNFKVDVRDKKSVLNIFKSLKFHVVIHTAAQPSHDKAADIPFDDFETNAFADNWL